MVNDFCYDKDHMILDPMLFNDEKSAKQYNGVYQKKNKKGQVVEETIYYKGKKDKTRYSYNKKGLLSKMEAVATEGTTSTYTYDGKNRIIKNVTVYNGDRITTKYTYEKDNDLLVINEMEYAPGDVLKNHLIYTYHNGLIVALESAGKVKSSFGYQFDKNGNWINQFEYENWLDDNGKWVKIGADEEDPYIIEQNIVYRNQLKNIDTKKAVVKRFSYRRYELILKAGETEIHFPSSKVGNDIIIYNPFEKEYFLASNASTLLNSDGANKSVPIKSQGKVNSILKHQNKTLVNGRIIE
ncbi:hypothetical protein DDD_2520 [Nonlabens dokdonensis DSW-6]|uniref:Uncharacterized protein n=2 Tax=Nonlabens dokdonensis TaxID=328515 RepID=L7WBP4_NONDD|nr:hypothetical protein DDD_2520 [Nonlabens dokdonensis DSW-6]